MPTDFSALLDTLLVIAGLVLVVTGLVMFIYSKTSTQASSVEAFGIKLNVTHPSLILVLAGVGLMLAPRLLPELPGKETEPKPAVAEAPQPESPPPASTQAVPAAGAPASPQAPAARPAEPAASAPATATRPTPPTGPVPVPYPNLAARTPPASAAVAETARPAVKPPPAKKPTAAQAAVPSPATRTAAAKPPPASTRPTLVYAALGLPISRDFWSGETRASYTARMQDVLQQAGRDVLRMDPRSLQLGEKEFNAWWNESNARPKSRELCSASPAPDILLSARVETPTTISSVESAYWPELQLRLYVCATQRLHRQKKFMAPQNDDAWPFSVDLNTEVERFLRSTRNDLAN